MLRLRMRALLLALLLFPALAFASSHSEAPGTARDRTADDTDMYAFVSADAPNAVTIVGNWVPLLEPAGGPNFQGFDDDVHYYLNVDNVGDALDHVRFEFTFKTTRANGDALRELLTQAPELVRGGNEVVRDTQELTQAARRTWLLRDYIEPSQMRTLPVDSFESFGKR